MQLINRVLKLLLGVSSKKGLIMLVTIGVFVGMIALSMSFFNRPVREVLYSGLGPEDVNQIGMVLSDVGIAYDVNEAGTAVLVDFGKTASARMILAEKGLPKSDKSGYQLFDQMGSLGLTSFMQQVTRVRALEGELVRTIQQLDGIKTARVHLALRSDATFRNKEEQATASVVVRTNGRPSEQTTSAIRHIVAAAIPGLTPENVTVMTTDGTLINGNQAGSGEPDHLLELEKSVSTAAQTRIERTLAPIVGQANFRVSVSTSLDTGKRSINETNYDPESKVERSVRSTKSSDQSSDGSNAQSVSVDQNIPQEVKPASSPEASSKKRENKEETINYEVNSKQTTTQTAGFVLQKQSLAVVLNKQALLKSQGATPDEKKLGDQVKEIEEIVKSAAGYDEKRGDSIHVSAVDFAPEDVTLEPIVGPSLSDTIKGNLGTIINATALITAISLILLLGLRPMLKQLSKESPINSSSKGDGNFAISNESGQAQLKLPSGAEQDLNSSGGLREGPNRGGHNQRGRLNDVIGGDVDRAAQVLKQWLATSPDNAT